MRLVYMGTPQFSVQPLRSLVEAGHELVGVVTRIDKPSGRGRVVAAPPAKLAAQELGLPVLQPPRVREPGFIAILRELNPEAIVVAAYGQLLPEELLKLPKYGCINIHASLLPLYRGAAPVNWAIIRGAAFTGITIMQMDAGMDTGKILRQESIPIDRHDTTGTLIGKLSLIGATMIVAALPLIASGSLSGVAQDDSRATLAPILKKADGLIDWKLPVAEIHNRVRGFSPWPGAYTFLEGKMVKIVESAAEAGSGEPGVLYAEARDVLTVGTGNGLLRIVSIQPEGKKPMTAAEFLRGHRGVEGEKFDKPVRGEK